MSLTPTIKSAGTTETERHLSRLCDETFLSLWSYPNLYTDEGLSKTKQGKELCDLLCVFGRDIVIFSDKSISFSEKEIGISWPRWYRRAIYASAKQILGAEKWIKEHGDRVFLDKLCKNRFPLPIESGSGARFHRIVVARNSKESAERYFGAGSSGSLVIRPDLCGEEHAKHPFHVGMIFEGGPYIHVLDDTSLDLVLGHLDTASDFVNYLAAKEDAITNGMLRSAAGEEEILAFYLATRRGASERRDLVPPSIREGARTLVLIEGLWDEYSSSESYEQEKELLKISYLWDDLLKRISGHVLAGDAIGPHKVDSHEKVIRLFAAECRRSRLVLSEQILEKYQQVPADRRSARVVRSPSDPKKAFIFLFFPRDHGQEHHDYREERQEAALAYALTLKLMSPEFRHICVVATEPKQSDGRSEDFMALDIPELSKDEKREIRQMQREMEIFTDMLKPFAVPDHQPRRPRSDRTKRNSPCPCGSGSKFKQCCL
ncbi:SEC-C domain-containing protein [Pseudoxanthomonas daejeonensis]|uniref:YecA/YgfB family protein n=1 Tax=Pseudoxanthomonas daejeonensis TaxID=266062 RepID=UPI001F544D3D|nr:SEC-C metal-binding domain-containing protein [Pseudoxanthomonas daejeonensis]UNK57898.1 SEC-C domain-containing protein [Pseudoxanthomonas daejeonensis]